MQTASWVREMGVTQIVSEEDIRSAIFKMAYKINEYYEKHGVREVVIICILKGACVFFSHLVEELGKLVLTSENPVDYRLDFLRASSYEKSVDGKKMVSTGTVKIIMDIDTDIAGKNVLLVEDILDTSLTLSKTESHLQLKKPQSFKVACLATKESSPKELADFLGLVLPNEYVWGTGLDKEEQFRNWPGIWFAG